MMQVAIIAGFTVLVFGLSIWGLIRISRVPPEARKKYLEPYEGDDSGP